MYYVKNTMLSSSGILNLELVIQLLYISNKNKHPSSNSFQRLSLVFISFCRELQYISLCRGNWCPMPHVLVKMKKYVQVDYLHFSHVKKKHVMVNDFLKQWTALVLNLIHRVRVSQCWGNDILVCNLHFSGNETSKRSIIYFQQCICMPLMLLVSLWLFNVDNFPLSVTHEVYLIYIYIWDILSPCCFALSWGHYARFRQKNPFT